jgi:hypothetical protein
VGSTLALAHPLYYNRLVQLASTIKFAHHSRFRGNGPQYYDLFCSIFIKITVTGEYSHASTITQPDLDKGDCGFDLNNPTPVIDLSDGDGASAPNNLSKSKGK